MPVLQLSPMVFKASKILQQNPANIPSLIHEAMSPLDMALKSSFLWINSEQATPGSLMDLGPGIRILVSKMLNGLTTVLLIILATAELTKFMPSLIFQKYLRPQKYTAAPQEFLMAEMPSPFHSPRMPFSEMIPLIVLTTRCGLWLSLGLSIRAIFNTSKGWNTTEVKMPPQKPNTALKSWLRLTGSPILPVSQLNYMMQPIRRSLA